MDHRNGLAKVSVSAYKGEMKPVTIKEISLFLLLLLFLLEVH